MDESGDVGFKLDKGSSALFVLTAVIFDDPSAAGDCDTAIDQLRAPLRMHPAEEFHFSGCSNRIKQAFFDRVASEKFKYASFVLNKGRTFSNKFSTQDGMYGLLSSWLIGDMRSRLKDAKVVLDRCADRQFSARLKKVLSQQVKDAGGQPLIRKLVLQDSRSNNLVQLADMVCGAVRRSCGPQGDHRFRNLIRKNEERVRQWPP